MSLLIPLMGAHGEIMKEIVKNIFIFEFMYIKNSAASISQSVFVEKLSRNDVQFK